MRLDIALVGRQIVKSRSVAKRLIEDGLVLINGTVAIKTNTTVHEHDHIQVTELPRFVSRAGEKLEKALEHWSVDMQGKTILDIGSSTGGFTDCALQYGAQKVIAVDVGTDQFDTELRQDPRIELYEKTDIRNFYLDTPVDMIVCDVSFIPLRKIIPHLHRFIEKGQIVLLIKPQFEVGQDFLNKQGIVVSEEATQKCIADILKDLENAGWKNLEVIDSPIRGGDGNREFLVGGVI